MDARWSKRPFWNQWNGNAVLTSPLNVITHLGTPGWLKEKLFKSPVLIPSTRIFPSLQKLRKNFSVIKEEALRALKLSKPIKNDLYFQGIADEGWRRFYLKWYGPDDKQALTACPKTCLLLKDMPEVHLAMFSILMPGSKILPHFGPARFCLRYHLGISTPNDDKCHIKIGTDEYSWRDEKDVIFDDTFTHEVRNDTKTPRIILFLDIERPQDFPFNYLSSAMIKYLAPITTRGNDDNEKATFI